MTRLADLPAEVRAKIQSGNARVRGPAVPHRAPSRPAGPRSTSPQFRCFTCRETFVAWAPAERHGRANVGHRRIETLFAVEPAVEPKS